MNAGVSVEIDGKRSYTLVPLVFCRLLVAMRPYTALHVCFRAHFTKHLRKLFSSAGSVANTILNPLAQTKKHFSLSQKLDNAGPYVTLRRLNTSAVLLK